MTYRRISADTAQQKHSPDGKKRGGADAESLGGPLVMQDVPGDWRRRESRR